MKLKKISMLLLIMLLMTSCANNNYIVKVYDSGATNLKIRQTLDKSYISQIESITGFKPQDTQVPDAIIDITPLLQESAYKLHVLGYNIELFNSEELNQTGFIATKYFDSKEVFNSEVENLKKVESIPFDLKIETKKSFLKNDYQIKGDLNLFNGDNSLIDKLSELEDQTAAKEYIDKMETTLNIVLPGKMAKGENDSGTLDADGSILYKATRTEQKVNVNLISSKTNIKNIVIPAVGLIVIIGTAIFIKKRRG